MKTILLALIKIYKASISPLIDLLFGRGNTCRFAPTCSVYAYEAIERYGVIKGSFLSIKRILRCHPWSKGGHDPLA